MMTDIPGAAMMRMIDDEQSIAQCDFRPLATLQAGQQWTLEAFQKDVKETLGDQLTGLVGPTNRSAIRGLRVMRVIAAGAVARRADPVDRSPFFRRFGSPLVGDLYNGR